MILLLCSIVVWGKASPFARLQADKTTLTVVADPPEGGSVSGGGSYESGTSVQLRASANTGFQFVSWTRDGEVVSTANNFKYTKGEGNETLVAHFIYNPSNPSEPDQPNVKKKYVLNLVADEGGYSLSGAGTYAEGTSVRVSVYANTGFVFVGWYDSSEALVSDQSRFDYVVTGNETLTARFKYAPDSPSEPTQPDIKHNYVLTLLTEEGGYSLSGAGTYQEGTSVRINVYAETGYLFTGWYDSHGELVSSQSRFDYVVTGHATLTARFKYNPDSPSEPTQPDIKISHRITAFASPEDGGTVSVENAIVYEGETTRVRAYTNTGFVFQGWYVADTLFQTASDFYYTMGKKDISMEARFVYNPSSPSEPDVPDNRKYSIYLTSTRGLPGRTVQYPIYLSSLDSLTNIQFNLTFPAGLTPDIENIKLSGKAQGYTLNCEEVEVTAEEAGGAPRRAADRETAYQFTLTDGKLPACNTRLMVIDVAISENVTDTTQQVKINQVTVTDTDGTNTTASTRNGTVEMKESSGDGTYYYLTLISTGSGQATVNSKTVRNSLHIFDLLEGSSTNVYFTPDNGYHIDKVTLDEVDITDLVLESSRYLFSNVSADATLTVMFAEGVSSTYNLTLKTDGHGKISYNEVEVGEEETVFSISHGAHVEMLITPDEGYHIKQVLLNDTIDVTSQVTESKFVIESMMTASKVFVSFEETPTVETPLIVRNGNKVAISTTTEEAVIYYTLDGSEPTDQSMVYTDSITVEYNCTVKAIALREDYYPSQVATFEVDWFKVADVTFVQNGRKVSLSTPTADASIYYKIGNGDLDVLYTDTLTLDSSCTIRATAKRDGYTDADVTSYEFNADSVTVAKPVFAREGNTVIISTATPEAVIHYTLDGTLPTDSSAVYDKPIVVEQNGVIKAIATRQDWFDSEADSLVVDWIVIGDASFDGLVATVSGERMLDEAFDSAGGRSEAAKTIAAIIWNKSTPITESDLQGLDNPNMLIYVNGSEQAPANRDNVVIGDFAKNIVLTDVEIGNNNFYCPKEFKAEMISYTRDFQQQTEIGVSRGWESIALPFNVQIIMHEKRGLIAPFGNDASDKHFWLRRLTQEGVTRATAIEANTPYLISMPNSSEYPAEYNLSGRVTFSSQDVKVPVTTDYADVMHDTTTNTMIVFYPAMHRVFKDDEVYVLNVGDAQAGYAEGSVFVAGLREVRPFEAYTWHHAQGPAPRYIPINELNGGTTGIEDVRSLMSDGRSGVWYDLNGRCLLQKPKQKGVYILNGTKIVVK